MDNEDEIEFFGFMPVSFVEELHEEIESVLREGVRQLSVFGKGKMDKISDVLLGSFKKNYFIFSNFVLRNIFRFPPSFKPERRVSDIVVTENLQTITNDLVRVLEEEDYYEAEIQRQRENAEIEKYRKDSYVSLLKCSDSINDLLLGIKLARNELEEVRELYNKLSMVKVGGDDLNTLVEYREIKSGLAKKERDDLMAIGSDEVLAMMNRGVRK